MDILSELMRSVGANPAYLGQGTAIPPWGMDFPRIPGAAFHMITSGSCWLNAPGLDKPIRLETGDLVLVSNRLLYTMFSDVDAPVKPVREVLYDHPPVQESEAVAAGATTFICGIYRFIVEPIHPFFAELPAVIHLHSYETAAHEPILSAQRMLSAELALKQSAPGSSILVKRLVDVMFYYILRQWMERENSQGHSWLKAYHNTYLQKALIAIHEQPAYPWQVATLAQKASLSRAAFARLFKTLVRETPLDYVTRVRMQQAMELLTSTEKNIDWIAENVGYSTGFAFSKAFKRVCGISPQGYRQQAQPQI
jgi:AraC-like DNA-binding protein